MRRTSQRGFTLIELMTVLAIVAILTTALAGLSSGGGAGTPSTTADNIAGMMGFARLRAEAKRTIHKVQIEPNVISVWEADAVGFGTSGSGTYLLNKVVSSMDVPSGVVVWNFDGSTTGVTGGATPVQGAGFNFAVQFRPDGTSTGGTLYLTDHQTSSKYRVFVYKTTGNAQTRDGW